MTDMTATGGIDDLGLAPEMEAAFAAAGITTQHQLARLGFDAACELPGVWRAGVKGAFSALADQLRPRYRAAAIAKYGEEGRIEFPDEPEVSISTDDGAYVQAWVWVSNDELETT